MIRTRTAGRTVWTAARIEVRRYPGNVYLIWEDVPALGWCQNGNGYRLAVTAKDAARSLAEKLRAGS